MLPTRLLTPIILSTRRIRFTFPLLPRLLHRLTIDLIAFSPQWYPYQEATGYNADMDITWVGDTIEEGLIGSITIGLNMQVPSLQNLA